MPEDASADEAISTQRFTIAWVCALQEEYDAACRMLDAELEDVEPSDADATDNNAYTFGTIGGHHVVIGCLPAGRYGITSAAKVARDMSRSFPNLKLGLMVGIGGGAPSAQRDIRLGDVVVAVPYKTCGGVVQYDFGKWYPDGRFERTGYLNAAPDALLSVVRQVRRLYNDPTKVDRLAEHVKRMDPFPEYRRPAADCLYRSDYPHKAGRSCDECSSEMVVERAVRPNGRQFMVHYGTVASGNSVIKDAKIRDLYANDPELNVLCFEMEAAGLMNDFPCLVIRGICDYADTHKNNEWHNYAALTAAAYAREVLLVLKPRKVDWMPLLAGRIKEISNSLAEVQNNTGITKTAIEKLQLEYQSSKLQAWLNAPDISGNVTKGQGLRYKDTGSWLLTHSKFQMWKTGQRQHLWLHGIPGCGKSVLCSTVIEHLQEEQGSSSSGIVLGFFFDFTDSSKSSLDELLRSLLEQLYLRSPASRPVLELLHDESETKMRHPTTKLLASTFLAMSQLSAEPIQIVIDALDECRTRSTLLAWIQELLQAENTGKIQLLLSSRREEEIERALSSCLSDDDSISIQGGAVDADIKAYIYGTLRSGNGFQRWSARPDVLDEIEAELMKKAGGMFRWVACQLDVLENCFHIRALREALRSLPETLDETYARILKNIGREYRNDAIRLLQFMCFSDQPLTIEEAIDALAVDLAGAGHFDPSERMPVPREICRLCPSLVTSTPAGRIQLAHFSVREYLVSGRVEPSFRAQLAETEARASITRVCLTYMNHFGSLSTAHEICTSFPLASHAAGSWMKHARYAERLPDVLQTIKVFLLERVRAYAHWLSLVEPDEPSWIVPPQPRLRRARTKLYYAALAGLPHTVRLLLDQKASIDEEGGFYGTALQAACVCGHEDVVRVLLDGGADVNAKCGLHRDALTAACFRGHENIVKMLLTAGARVDSADPLSALHVARSEHHDGVVCLLLDRMEDTPIQQNTSGLCHSLEDYDSSGSDKPLANDYTRFWSMLFPGGPYAETTDKTYHTWQLKLSAKWNARFRVDPNRQTLWRVLLFVSTHNETVSIFLQPSASQPGLSPWQGLAQFAFVVWNPDDPSRYLARSSIHYFRPGQSNWGFRKFSLATELARILGNSSRPSSIAEIEMVNLTVYLQIPRVQNMALQTLRQPRGIAIGLANKARTGWLNVLLQTYYHINAFRRIVYHIPKRYRASKEIWALQRIFHAMQTSQVPVSTDELISALGWNTGADDAQRKALEFLYILEQRMNIQAPAASGDLKRLFEGQAVTYHSALDFSQGSSRRESFWELTLDISPHHCLTESFQNYIQPYGFDDSDMVGRGLRGVQVCTLERFPPVLQIHLKRFKYDLSLPGMVKDDSLWQFPEEVDLAPFLSFSADRSEPWLYRLFGVVTHEGSMNDGVYYAYLRPNGEGPFVRFHDTQVTAASFEEVFVANAGGDCGNMHGASKSAYMLFYYRVSRLQELFGPVTDADLPPSLRCVRFLVASNGQV